MLFNFVDSTSQTLLPIIEDPAIVEINRLPSRASFFAFESVKFAQENDINQSKRYLSLKGFWKFNWAKNPSSRPVEFYKTDFSLACYLSIHNARQNHHITLVFSHKTIKNSRLCGKGRFWTKTVDPCFRIWPYGHVFFYSFLGNDIRCLVLRARILARRPIFAMSGLDP